MSLVGNERYRARWRRVLRSLLRSIAAVVVVTIAASLSPAAADQPDATAAATQVCSNKVVKAAMFNLVLQCFEHKSVADQYFSLDAQCNAIHKLDGIGQVTAEPDPGGAEQFTCRAEVLYHLIPYANIDDKSRPPQCRSIDQPRHYDETFMVKPEGTASYNLQFSDLKATKWLPCANLNRLVTVGSLSCRLLGLGC